MPRSQRANRLGDLCAAKGGDVLEVERSSPGSRRAGDELGCPAGRAERETRVTAELAFSSSQTKEKNKQHRF